MIDVGGANPFHPNKMGFDNFSLTAEVWMHIMYVYVQVLHAYLNLKVYIN